MNENNILTNMLTDVFNPSNPVNRFIASIRTVYIDVIISVEEGTFLLQEKNFKNRKMNQRRVELYKRDILSNNWNYDVPSTICFDLDGNILDGQKRLLAHVLAGKSFKTIIVCGVSPKIMGNIDEGEPRNDAMRCVLAEGNGFDNIKISVKNQMFAVANFWNQALTKTSKPMTCTEKENFIKAKKEFIESAIVRGKFRYNRKAGYRAAIAQYFEKHKLKAQKFHELVSGDGFGLSNSAAFRLRQCLENSTGGGGPLQKENYAVTVSMIHKYHLNQDAPRKTLQTEWTI